MMKVGLTGGIGSGKTIISQLFSLLGVPVFNADVEAKYLMLTVSLRTEITKVLGKDAYTKKGFLNKKHIANIIFSDKEKLQQINAIVHPAVGLAFDKFVEKNIQAPYIIKEAAILIENKMYQALDKLILVSSDEEKRIQRVVERDNLTAQEVKSKIQNQMTDEKKKQYVNFVINNNETELLIPQIMKIHQELIHKRK